MPELSDRESFASRLAKVKEAREKSPIYLAHVLEHNYLKKTDGDKVKLGGVVIGLALNSVYSSRYEGEEIEVDIPDNVVEAEGKKLLKKSLNA